MAYFIDLFSPETCEAFTRSSRDVSGFRLRHKKMAERVSSSDVFVCYLTRLSRWFGLLEVVEGPCIDDTPILLPESDPFVVRFRVRPVVWLDIDKAVPIHDDTIWTGLSFTRGLEKGSIAWTGKVRGSLVRLDNRDGKFLAEQLTAQSIGGRLYPLDEQESRTLTTHTVTRTDKVVTVSVPDDAGAIDNAIELTIYISAYGQRVLSDRLLAGTLCPLLNAPPAEPRRMHTETEVPLSPTRRRQAPTRTPQGTRRASITMVGRGTYPEV